MVIKASDSTLFMSEDVFERILKVFKENNPDFELHQIEGGHHVHMDKPEVVARIINAFLEKPFKEKGSEDKQHMPFI